MANADTQSQIDELLAALGQELSSLSAEEIGRLYNKKDQFVEQCGTIAAKLAVPEPIAPPAHETIRIYHTVGDLRIVACGFLKAREPSVKEPTMLERVGKIEGTRAIDEAAWMHLYGHRADFGKCTGLNGRYLATERRDPRFPQGLSCFGRDGRGWYVRSGTVGNLWIGNVLVLRLCS